MSKVTKEQVQAAQEKHGSIVQGARALGISRRTAQRILKDGKARTPAGSKSRKGSAKISDKFVADLQQQLAAEKAKVYALLDVRNKTTIEVSDTSEIQFALMGDLHFGSLYHNAPALKAFYEVLKQNEIRKIYVSGDIIEGHKMYRGQEFEVRDLGLEAQLAAFAEECPRVDGINVHFITGNHDSSFKKNVGAPVGRLLSQLRSDWNFLGEDQALVRFETPNGPYSLELLHPGGGSAYALSYRPQKIVESLMGGQKPNMLAIGHFHKAEFIPSYRNVSVLQTGTFQSQTPFMAGKGLAAHIGGWIVTVKVGQMHNQVRTEFIAFYH